MRPGANPETDENAGWSWEHRRPRLMPHGFLHEAPKARYSKAQGGRAREAGSGTLGFTSTGDKPCKGGTKAPVPPLQGLEIFRL